MAGKKKAKPLTQRVFEAVAKHGPATTDAIARRCGVKAPAAGKALSKNKSRALMDFTTQTQDMLKGLVLLTAIITDNYLNPRDTETDTVGDL